MQIAENTQRAATNPIAEILEPIRQRVLRERTAQDERDGCLVIDYLDDLRPPCGASADAPGAWSLRSHVAGARLLRRCQRGPSGRGRCAPRSRQCIGKHGRCRGRRQTG